MCCYSFSCVFRKPNPDTNQRTGAAFGLTLITFTTVDVTPDLTCHHIQ